MKSAYLLSKVLICTFLISTPMVFAQTAFSSQKCGWAYVGNTHDGAIKAYIDYCKIGYVGRYRFAYFMTDYKTPVKNVRGDYYKSEIRKRLFDCQSKQKVDTQFIIII